MGESDLIWCIDYEAIDIGLHSWIVYISREGEVLSVSYFSKVPKKAEEYYCHNKRSKCRNSVPSFGMEESQEQGIQHYGY